MSGSKGIWEGLGGPVSVNRPDLSGIDPTLEDCDFVDFFNMNDCFAPMMSMYPDPIWVNHPPDAWSDGVDLHEEYEEVDEDVVGATGPISLCCELSPDYAAKEGDGCIDHVGPPQMQFIRCTQNPTIDPTFEGFVQDSKWAE